MPAKPPLLVQYFMLQYQVCSSHPESICVESCCEKASKGASVTAFASDVVGCFASAQVWRQLQYRCAHECGTLTTLAFSN